ncbi:MAG: DUF5067 domain-containing protein [Clostridiales bacterium]|nr:DUF5067 domain-containing protein [Clostridiales bacterium]
MGLIVYAPAVMFFVAAIIMIVKLKKTKHPDKIARIFAVIAVISGLIFLGCSFYPFDYDGPGGIDYIGQAIVWALMVKCLLYTALGIYISFAVAATVYAIKAMKKKETRKSGVISLILSWICGLVIIGIILTNVVSEQTHKRNIKVSLTDITQTVDSDGDDAVFVSVELRNDTKREISYLGSVYDEVTQGGRELSHALIAEIKDYSDNDIKLIDPGSSITVKKGYKLKSTSEPIKLHFSSYGGDVVYGDYTREVPNK